MDVATPTTPAASTEPSPAAPAISAPAHVIAPDQRPTFAQAFAADATLDTPDPSADSGTPARPAADGQTPESASHPSPGKQGPIPFEVHTTALANARTKAKAEAVAELDQTYGWMKAAPVTSWQHMREVAEQLNNPPAFLDKYFGEAVNHPVHGAAVRSWAARTLATRAPGGKPPDLSPDVTVQDADGREVARTFSAERMQAIVAHTVQDLLGKEVTPLKQDLEHRKAQEQQRALEARQADTQKQLEAHTDAVFEDLAALLDIGEATPQTTKDALYAEVGALLDADPALSPHKAAMQVRKTRIVPALQGQAQHQVWTELTKKAGAQGLNPQSAVVAPTHRPTSLLDPSLSWD